MMDPNILRVTGPGFLNQVPTLDWPQPVCRPCTDVFGIMPHVPDYFAVEPQL